MTLTRAAEAMKSAARPASLDGKAVPREVFDQHTTGTAPAAPSGAALASMGGFRRNAFKVVGFNGTVTDFSGVRFPAKLSNCLKCHIDVNGKGTFELPLKSTVLGSTVKTGGTIDYQRSDGQIGNLVDLDPTNNLRITPIASVCSSCDGSGARRHMRSPGVRSDGALFHLRCAGSVGAHYSGQDPEGAVEAPSGSSQRADSRTG